VGDEIGKIYSELFHNVIEKILHYNNHLKEKP